MSCRTLEADRAGREAVGLPERSVGDKGSDRDNIWRIEHIA